MKMHPEEFHLFTESGKSFLLHVPSSLFFVLDPVAHTFFTLLRTRSPEEACQHVSTQFTQEEADEMMAEFRAFQEEAASMSRPYSPSVGITSISLNVAQECNLACRYCYGSGGTYGSRGFMTPRVGEASIDFLFEQLRTKECSVGFFGGEPLLNMKLLKHLIPYALKKGEDEGKTVHFTITTNGTLLSDELIRFLNENNIHIVLSIDGPREIQDYNRPFKNGTGSYDIIYLTLKSLLTSRKGRITARSTAVRDDHYYAVFNHLMGLGFNQVHIEPATGGTFEPERIISDYRKISKDIMENIQKERHVLFSNLSDLMGKTYATTKKYHGCGAALRYVGISTKGKIYVCHRFVGIEEASMGTVWDFNPGIQKKILESHVDNREHCRECWARYYCGGGCIYESYYYYKDMTKPYTDRCELFKTSLMVAIWLYSQLKEEDQTILDDMYEKYTREYVKQDGSEPTHSRAYRPLHS